MQVLKGYFNALTALAVWTITALALYWAFTGAPVIVFISQDALAPIGWDGESIILRTCPLPVRPNWGFP